MDKIQYWWRVHTQRWGLWLLTLLFALPALTGVLGRLTRHKQFGIDFDAVVCAATNALHGASVYAEPALCAGRMVAPYLYAPWVARALAPAIEAIGPDGVRLAYAPVCILAMIFLFWLGFCKQLGDLRWRDRIPFLAVLTGGALASGNASYPLHAWIALAALALPRGRILFVLAVAIACTIKPHFAVYLTVLLLEERPLWRRILTGAWAGALCVVAGLSPLLMPDPDQASWNDVFRNSVAGNWGQAAGFLGWWAYFGAPQWQPAMYVGYVLFTGTMIVAALVMVARTHLGVWERVAFGLGLAALLNPRLMDYDLLLIGLAPLVLVVAATREEGRFGAQIWSLLLIVCSACVLINVADMTRLAVHLTPLLLSALVLYGCVRLGLRK